MTTTEKKQDQRQQEQPRALKKEIKRLRASRDNQKGKNRERAKVVKELKDSLRETKESRDSRKTEIKELKLEVRLLKRKLERQASAQSKYKDEIDILRGEQKKNQLDESVARAGVLFEPENTEGSHYPLSVILLCLQLVIGGALPFRSAARSLGITFNEMEELSRYHAPSYGTVKRWAEKLGYYKLHLPRKKEDSWMLIIDASIQTGDQKCVIILGCPSKRVPIGSPLKLKDLEVLSVKITRKLTGEQIADWLEEVRDRVGKIDGICSDRGSDLLCGIRLFQIGSPDTRQVGDTAHRVANFIKKKLEKDSRWKSFKKKVTQARRTMQNSTVAGAIPPNLRAKARYMNVDSLIKWADGMLYLLDYPEEVPDYAKKLKEYLGWLQDYRVEIDRWTMFVSLADRAKKLVSVEGMRHGLEDRFIEEIVGIPLDTEGLEFSDDILEFFRAHSTTLDHDIIYIGSSEILESLFGKLKFMEGDQTSFGFTSLVLAAVAHVGPLDSDMVAKAIGTVRQKDIQKWSEAQIGTSVQSVRKNLQQIVRLIKKKVVTKLAGSLGGKAVGF